MPSIANLFHVAIKTNDLDATVHFYRNGWGCNPVARHDFGYPGAWLAAPSGAAIIHIYAGGAALGPGGAHLTEPIRSITFRSRRPISMALSKSSKSTARTGANSMSAKPGSGNYSFTIRAVSSLRSLLMPPRREGLTPI